MGRFILFFGYATLCTVIRAVCFIQLWTWFAAGFLGIAAPSLPIAIGLLTLGTLVISDAEGIREAAKSILNKEEDNPAESFLVLTISTVFNLLLLFTGWIVKIFFL